MSSTPHKPWREALLLAALLLGSELACGLAALNGGLGQAGVADALRPELEPLVPRLVAAGVPMLLLTAALTLALTRAWAACAGPARAACLGRHAGTRAARLGAGAVSTWAFVCAWLSLHAALLPGSRLSGSWVAWASGAFDGVRPVLAGRLVAPLLAGVIALGLLACALARSPALRRRAAGLAGGALVVVAGYGWITDPGAPRPVTQSGNVVLLGLDSFQTNRLDDLPGHPTAAPHIAGLLDECSRFDSAWTPLARTYPSWNAILSGRWPGRNGVRFNLAPDEMAAPDNRYLGDVLREAGYATLHATDETRFSNIRARHGFETLLCPETGAQDFVLASFFDFSALNVARQFALGHDLFAPLRWNRASPSYNPRLFVRGVRRLLDEAPRDRPLFLTLHLCGNHWPFSAPAPWAWRGRDPIEGCLAMVDAQVEELLSDFRACGLLDRSLLVLMSDHGDGWRGPGDKTNSHGDDFRSLWANRVVLGLHGAGVPPGRVETLVRTIDVYPTVLDALGLPVDEAAIDGRSLLPLARGAAEPPRPLFAETEIDRRSWSVGGLLAQNARWYRVEPQTGLVRLRDEGARHFLPDRQYLWIDGERRIVVEPGTGTFRANCFDPVRGLDLGGDVPAADRERLLRGLSAHFGLDTPALLADARAAGFLDAPLASR